MGANFSGGGATVFHDRTDTPGEIIRELVNASDGQGLHFDGVAGNIDIATVPDLGTKFSFEFILQANDWATASYRSILDFGASGRFRFGQQTAEGTGANLSIYDTEQRDFGVAVLSDDKVHHLVVTVDGTAAILYDNGNQVGTVSIATPTINLATDAAIGSNYPGSGAFFNGTIYRARFWNKTLSQAEVTASYENATVPFADQYGSQTNKITGAVDKNWGTAQADSGNDVTDRATFDTNYVWTINGTVTDISVASNVLQFTTATVYHGIYYPAVLTANKRYRVTLKTGAITGDGFKVFQYGGALIEIGTLAASTTNIFEFTTPANSNTNLLVYGSNADGDSGAGTLQIDAASVPNSIVEIGCVADYDLAFANPTQSDQVQDRSTNLADGTASAGVTQVTKIEAVNTNKLNVGGTTPLVGIGLPAGVTPVSELDCYVTMDDPDATATWMSGVNIRRNTDGDIGMTLGISTVNVSYIQAKNISSPVGMKLVLNPAGGNVGVGITPATQFDCSGGVNSDHATFSGQAGRGLLISTENTLNNDDGAVLDAQTSSGKLIFKTVGVERLRIDSAGLATFSAGIALGNTGTASTGTPSSPAQTLDWYEVGTFTPTITGSSVAGTHSGPVLRGDYVRVGNICTVSGYYYGTSGTGSGDMILGGLPFLISGSTVAVGSIQANAGLILAAGSIPAWITGGGATFKVRQTLVNGNAFSYAAYPTDPTYLRFTITYITA